MIIDCDDALERAKLKRSERCEGCEHKNENGDCGLTQVRYWYVNTCPSGREHGND